MASGAVVGRRRGRLPIILSARVADKAGSMSFATVGNFPERADFRQHVIGPAWPREKSCFFFFRYLVRAVARRAVFLRSCVGRRSASFKGSANAMRRFRLLMRGTNACQQILMKPVRKPAGKFSGHVRVRPRKIEASRVARRRDFVADGTDDGTRAHEELLAMTINAGRMVRIIFDVKLQGRSELMTGATVCALRLVILDVIVVVKKARVVYAWTAGGLRARAPAAPNGRAPAPLLLRLDAARRNRGSARIDEHRNREQREDRKHHQAEFVSLTVMRGWLHS